MPWAGSLMREIAARPGGLVLPFLATACIAAVAAALLLRPAVALTGILVLCALTAIFTFARAIPGMFLGVLGVVLLGYAFLGRSFAYLGVPPLFIGEIMLALGLVAALLSGYLLAVARSPVTWLIVALSALGTARTVPYLGPYGLEALRDATVWGYSAFALAVAACVLSTRSIPGIARQYEKWIFRFAAWGPVGILLTRLLGSGLPNMPGTEISLISTKPGDAGVHLAGAAVFVLLGLHRRTDDDERDRRSTALFWVLWLISLAFVTSLNRGGFLAAMTALLVVGVLEPVVVGKRLMLSAMAAVALSAVVMLGTFSVEDTSKVAAVSEERALSPRQVVENIVSIVGGESQARGNLASTREWRLDWWRTIIDYTVFGRYFWGGKGFGINLADDDGFQVATEDLAPLRSPHNAYMTVLARMGVPGIVLWMTLQLCFGLSLVDAHLRARRAGALWWARLDLWILGYWCAFLVNAAFDVFLEGPQGGVLFWCLVGLGIAALEVQRRDIPRQVPNRIAR